MPQPFIEVTLAHSGLSVSLRAQVDCEGGRDGFRSARSGFEGEPIELPPEDLFRDLVGVVGGQARRAHQSLLASLLQSEARLAEARALEAAEQALEDEGALVGLTD